MISLVQIRRTTTHESRLERVLVAEGSCGEEVGHSRLDAGQVPVVVDGRVVDEAHLLQSRKESTYSWTARSETLFHSPNHPFPFIAPQCGADGRNASVSRASRLLQLTPGTRKIGWKSLTPTCLFPERCSRRGEGSRSSTRETAAAEVEC